VPRPTVLVTGGAGYIGSHVVLALLDAGWPVVVLDDLSTGRRETLAGRDVRLVVGDVGDGELLRDLLAGQRIRAVVHLAGAIRVPESIRKPLLYSRKNTVNSVALIEACVAADVAAFVFSSTAAVYGTPERNPVTEDAPTRPLSPYGRTKLMVEHMLADVDAAHRLPYVALRYFNVAGADPAGRAGPAAQNATSLLKVACELAVGHRSKMTIFGDDYPTPDGTCIRDFVHVSDLASAHVHALDYLLGGGASRVLNCGYGRGYSVREVVDTVRRLHGRPFAVEHGARRPGDAAEVVAGADLIREVLRWQPRYADLERIVADALAFEQTPAS